MLDFLPEIIAPHGATSQETDDIFAGFMFFYRVSAYPWVLEGLQTACEEIEVMRLPFYFAASRFFDLSCAQINRAGEPCTSLLFPHSERGCATILRRPVQDGRSTGASSSARTLDPPSCPPSSLRNWG